MIFSQDSSDSGLETSWLRLVIASDSLGCGLVRVKFASGLPAGVAAIFDLIPVAGPLLPPGEWATTGETELGG